MNIYHSSDAPKTVLLLKNCSYYKHHTKKTHSIRFKLEG